MGRRALEATPGSTATISSRPPRVSTACIDDAPHDGSADRPNLAIDELAIPTRYAGEVSHLNPITYGLRALGIMASYLAGRYD